MHLFPVREYTFPSRTVKATAYLTMETSLLSGLFTAASNPTNCHGRKCNLKVLTVPQISNPTVKH